MYNVQCKDGIVAFTTMNLVEREKKRAFLFVINNNYFSNKFGRISIYIYYIRIYI